MIKEHGTFNQISSGGWVNEHGVHWNLYVLARVDYGPGGDLLALYEDDTKEVAVEIGTRWFAEVRNGVVDWVSANPSTLNPHSNALVIETTDQVSAGMLYADGAFQQAPPPPYVPISIPADLLFFDRMTDAEYDALDASVKTGESARVYRGWTAATIFDEGTAMWALLAKHLGLTVTAERKAELLARP